MTNRFSRSLCASAVLAFAGLWGGRAQSQPIPDGAPQAEQPAESEARTQAEARFRRGLSLFKQGATEAALAEFVASRNLFPTRAAIKNAGVCFRELHRFDEALDAFEEVLAKFHDLAPDERAFVEQQIAELRPLVGTVDVRVADPGATVVIDGRERGTTPVGAPIRVASGTHLVRIQKQGFLPLERRFDVAGNQTYTLAGSLDALVHSGRLRVVEQTGKPAAVIVDGATVGPAPWEGILAPGRHVVRLQSDGDIGTQPALATVQLNQVVEVSLPVERLPAELRIVPEPASAEVTLNDVPLGRGAWSGHVREDVHRIEVSEQGYQTSKETVTATGDKPTTVHVALKAIPSAAAAAAVEPGRLFVQASGGLALIPSFGGELSSSCGSGCDASMPLGFAAGIRGGYAAGSGLQVTADVGYVAVSQKLDGRSAVLREEPRAIRQEPGQTTDDLSLKLMMVGGSIGWQGGKQWPWQARLGVGAAFGSMSDLRSGRFEADGTQPGVTGPYSVTAVKETPDASFVFAGPEVRIGYAITSTVAVTAGTGADVLVALTQPSWQDKQDVVSPSLGYATYGRQTMTGKTIVLVMPVTLGVGGEF